MSNSLIRGSKSVFKTLNPQTIKPAGATDMTLGPVILHKIVLIKNGKLPSAMCDNCLGSLA